MANRNPPNNDGTSLWDVHERLILGMQDGRAECDLAESKRIAALPPLKPLQLPPRTKGGARLRSARTWLLTATPLVVLAASVLLSIRHEPTSARAPVVGIKGQTQVMLYWHRTGQVHRGLPPNGLRSGDQVRAAVVAATASRAYWGIIAGDGRLLSPIEDSVYKSITVPPGAVGWFPGSFRLVGANESEVLAVVVCPETRTPTPQELSHLLQGVSSSRLPTCERRAYELR